MGSSREDAQAGRTKGADAVAPAPGVYAIFRFPTCCPRRHGRTVECPLARIERLKASQAEAKAQLDQVRADLLAAFVAAHRAGEQVDLLEWIEAHLSATGTAASGFGNDLLGDPGFVRNLREGRKVRQVTDELVRRHLAR